MKSFSFIDRLKNISRLQSHEFDLVIIGGGITGAGAARDAAMRGLKVALIEARDFASGTSSRSSKLVHGGIRYLENMEFKLVFEALNERNKLFEMCPHLVHPLRFMIPLYQDSRVGMFKMGLGMWLYDALALFQAPEMHEHLTASESMDRMPILRSENLSGSYIYSDGYMDDDRLVHETLRAADAKGAAIANFIEATGAVFGENGKINEIVCRDSLGGKEFRIRGRHFISTVGPWTDELGERWFKEWKKILRPTKGIHLTFPKNRLPLSSAVVMAAEKSSRIVFAIPRHEMIVIGTTDTDFKGHPQDVRAEREDVEYLLKIANQYFPGARLRESDILASYAGVRPLVQDGSESEGKTSREHTIFTDERGVTFVAGGKYTTYRLMAEQVVDEALNQFPFDERVRYAKADTAKPLNPDTDPDVYRRVLYQADDMAKDFQRNAAEVRLLCERYGAEAERILARYNSEWSYWQMEAAQAIETTMCMNLTDFYIRRVPLYLATPGHGIEFADSVGRVFQQLLRWDDGTLAAQKEALLAVIARETAWRAAGAGR